MRKVPTGFAGFHSSIVDNPRDKGFRISHSSMSVRPTFVPIQATVALLPWVFCFLLVLPVALRCIPSP